MRGGIQAYAGIVCGVDNGMAVNVDEVMNGCFGKGYSIERGGSTFGEFDREFVKALQCKDGRLLEVVRGEIGKNSIRFEGVRPELP